MQSHALHRTYGPSIARSACSTLRQRPGLVCLPSATVNSTARRHGLLLALSATADNDAGIASNTSSPSSSTVKSGGRVGSSAGFARLHRQRALDATGASSSSSETGIGTAADAGRSLHVVNPAWGGAGSSDSGGHQPPPRGPSRPLEYSRDDGHHNSDGHRSAHAHAHGLSLSVQQMTTHLLLLLCSAHLWMVCVIVVGPWLLVHTVLEAFFETIFRSFGLGAEALAAGVGVLMASAVTATVTAGGIFLAVSVVAAAVGVGNALYYGTGDSSFGDSSSSSSGGGGGGGGGGPRSDGANAPAVEADTAGASGAAAEVSLAGLEPATRSSSSRHVSAAVHAGRTIAAQPSPDGEAFGQYHSGSHLCYSSSSTISKGSSTGAECTAAPGSSRGWQRMLQAGLHSIVAAVPGRRQAGTNVHSWCLQHAVHAAAGIFSMPLARFRPGSQLHQLLLPSDWLGQTQYVGGMAPGPMPLDAEALHHHHHGHARAHALSGTAAVLLAVLLACVAVAWAMADTSELSVAARSARPLLQPVPL